MEFVKSLASRVVTAAAGPAFPYTTGERVEGLDWTSIWSLHEGTKREDGSPVSVFVFDASKQRDKLPFARNALKRFKTIRHPSALHYLDSQETEDRITIVTEPVEPLAIQLKDGARNENLLMWGLYKLAVLLKFLNMDSSLVHGNVRISSIFTTKAGEWKLAGFELTGSLKEEGAMLPLYGGTLPDSQKYAPPEVLKSSWGSVRSYPPSSFDSWCYGCLIYEIFNGTFSRPEQMGQGGRGRIPQPLYSYYRNLLDPNPASRLNPTGLLDAGTRPGAFFDSDFIQAANFLEHINLKEQSEKERFVAQLVSKIDRFPDSFAKHKVLPELVNALEFGAGGAKMIAPILKLGESLSKESYDRIVLNAMVKMFSSPERQMRVALLENLEKFADRFEGTNNRLVNEKVFPEVVKGFNDTSGVMREYTLKSMLVIVPKLSERIANNDLLRYLAKLQVDEEPGIRTNTTILLGKISKYLSESTRAKILIPAFVRSLRDPFPPSRHAGLLSLGATIDYHDPQEVAQKAIPAISPLLLDPIPDVRLQAFKCMEICMKKLEKVAAAIPQPEPPARPSNVPVAENGPANPQPTTGATSSDWMGWAGSAVAGMSYSLASAVVDKASTALLVGGNADSMPAPAATPVARPTAPSNIEPEPSSMRPTRTRDAANGSMKLQSPMEPTRKPTSPLSSSNSQSVTSVKAVVSLPEPSGDMWGDWGSSEAPPSRESEDNWANFAEAETSPAKATSRQSSSSWIDDQRQKEKDMQPEKKQVSTGKSAPFADFPVMKPIPPPSKPSSPAISNPSPIAANTLSSTLPPPLTPVPASTNSFPVKPASHSDLPMPASKADPPSGKPSDDWADSWMQSMKTAPRASDRDKKKDERQQRLAELRAKTKAGSGLH